MKNKKQAGKGSVILWAVIIVGILLYNEVLDFDPEMLIPVVTVFVVTGVILAVVVAVSKTKAGGTGKQAVSQRQTAVPLNRPFPQPTAGRTKQAAPLFRHADEAEEAVSCAHRTGKEKYLEQVEGFYKNGLIDRAEYRLLREKYEKLDLPEDYH